MLTLILTIVGALLGIGGTILTYRLNPRQKIWDEMDSISKQLVSWERIQTDAVGKNDNDSLNIAHDNIGRLRAREAVLSARLKAINGG